MRGGKSSSVSQFFFKKKMQRTFIWGKLYLVDLEKYIFFFSCDCRSPYHHLCWDIFYDENLFYDGERKNDTLSDT